MSNLIGTGKCPLTDTFLDSLQKDLTILASYIKTVRELDAIAAIRLAIDSELNERE